MNIAERLLKAAPHIKALAKDCEIRTQLELFTLYAGLMDASLASLSQAELHEAMRIAAELNSRPMMAAVSQAMVRTHG